MNYLSESERLEIVEAPTLLGQVYTEKTTGTEAPPIKSVIHLEDGIALMPLSEKKNSSALSDTFLGQVFRRIVREESVYKLFYDGSVRDTRDFIEFMRNPENEIFFVNQNGKEVGFFWLGNFRQKSYFINYCFYKEFWGDAAQAISRVCIDFIFKRKNAHGDYLVDVLLGLTPANNKLAVKFLLKNGMTILGKVPGFLYDSIEDKTVDGIFSYRQRDMKTTLRLPSIFFVN